MYYLWIWNEKRVAVECARDSQCARRRFVLNWADLTRAKRSAAAVLLSICSHSCFISFRRTCSLAHTPHISFVSCELLTQCKSCSSVRWIKTEWTFLFVLPCDALTKRNRKGQRDLNRLCNVCCRNKCERERVQSLLHWRQTTSILCACMGAFHSNAAVCVCMCRRNGSHLSSFAHMLWAVLGAQCVHHATFSFIQRWVGVWSRDKATF